MVGVVAVLLLVLASPPSRAAEGDSVFGGGTSATGDAFVADALRELDQANTSSITRTSASGTPVEYVRAPACVSNLSRMAREPVCVYNDPYVEYCIDGSDAREPVWMREQGSDGTWTEWTVVTWYTCANDAALLEAIEREWSQLRPEPSVIALQPGNGRVLANVPTIAMAVDAPRLHSTTLLGAGVEIRATPSGYVWHWGDGESTATTDAGRPYPNATVTHTYAHASGDPEVELATTWTGEYRVNGGQWVSFDSTIESSAESVTLAVSNPRSRLVDCDVTDRCQLHASG